MTSNLARMRGLKKKVTMKPRENYSCGDLPQCHAGWRLYTVQEPQK